MRRKCTTKQLATSNYFNHGYRIGVHKPMKSKRLWAIGLLINLLACSSTSVIPIHRPSPAKTKQIPEPCWVKTPNCNAKAGDGALYFVGQSEQPLASWGRPKRSSTHSAQRDAEQQYARFLGVEISSSIYLQSLLKDKGYQNQFAHTITSNVNRTVSDLIKADEYSVAYQQTNEGMPLWSVYVLIKVTKESVDKHRLAVAQENIRRATTTPPADQWTATIYNIDDTAAIYVNGTQVTRCGYSESCTVNLNAHLKSGKNMIRLEYGNRFGVWTYGYKVHKNKEIMYEARCGQVWLYGCSWDMSTGVIHTFDFEVMQR
jgi:hypothetical protein